MVGDYQNAIDGVLATDIVKEPLRIHDGMIDIPEGDGLGMELDEDKLKLYRVDE